MRRDPDAAEMLLLELKADAQEALTNVARHSGASSCTIFIMIDEASVLCVEVRGDGRGMPTSHESSHIRTGVGPTSMRERTSGLGGSLLVETPEGVPASAPVCLCLRRNGTTQRDRTRFSRT
jgi:signal transduction histidine kinase